MPDVMPESQFYWNAFWALNHDRPFGMAMGGIPYAVMDIYARRNKLSDDDFSWLVDIIRALDTVWLKHINKSSQSK